MVCLLLVALFTYPVCLWSGSSGSPGGSDSPGYLSPDHPHPRSATLLSYGVVSMLVELVYMYVTLGHKRVGMMIN